MLVGRDSFFCLLWSCDHGIQNLWNSWPKIIILNEKIIVHTYFLNWRILALSKSAKIWSCEIAFPFKNIKAGEYSTYWFFSLTSSWKKIIFILLLTTQACDYCISLIYCNSLFNFMFFMMCNEDFKRHMYIFIFSGSTEFPRSNAIEAAILPLGDE